MMDRFEELMAKAAEETRQVTLGTPPPTPSGRQQVSIGGWAAFAVAFGAVIFAVGILPSLFSPDQAGPADTVATTQPVAAPSTELPVTTTTAAVPPVICSSTGVRRPVEPSGVPDQVHDVWLAAVEAALACDLDTLEQLAGDDFTTSFGGGDAEAFREWEEAGEGKLGLMMRLLDTDFAVQTFEGDAAEALGSDTLYVWPAAFARDSWEEITEEEMADLLTIHTQEELDQIALMGGYAGWRTGITAEGDWVFFVAGD
jgi:hypothetical protein